MSDCLPYGVDGFYLYTYLYGCRTKFLVGHSFIQFPFVFALYSHIVPPQPYYVGICFFALQQTPCGSWLGTGSFNAHLFFHYIRT